MKLKKEMKLGLLVLLLASMFFMFIGCDDEPQLLETVEMKVVGVESGVNQVILEEQIGFFTSELYTVIDEEAAYGVAIGDIVFVEKYDDNSCKIIAIKDEN